MKAYNQGISKAEFIAEIRTHQKLDNFIKGTYWNDQEHKGCAVGCSIASINKLSGKHRYHNNHKTYEKHLGIPEWLAILEDKIFERLPIEASKKWPLQFSKAINEGADLNQIEDKFKIKILEYNIKTQTKQLSLELSPEIKKLVEEAIKVNQDMIAAIKSKDKLRIEEAKEAADSAGSAVWSLESTRHAAWSAASAAKYTIWPAAWSAAWSVVWSTESAVESAAFSADSAAWATNHFTIIQYFSEVLLKLLEECR